MSAVDLLIVGAGPAGMGAAIRARALGLSVTLVDDQPEPGGQIWRSVESCTQRDEILGESYVEGRDVVRRFRASGATYLPRTQLWQLEAGFCAYVSCGGQASSIKAKCVIVATGAQERPIPFVGWTMPGVLTVGAAQILLKNAGQIPEGPIWVAGSGPLPLLYLTQLLRAGGEVAGYLDTSRRSQWRAALRYAPRALLAVKDLAKGASWASELRRKIPVIRGVSDIRVQGDGRLETLVYMKGSRETSVKANVLLVHEGVIPNIHTSLALDCTVEWDALQDCYRPVLDSWGESSRPKMFVAGDGASIAGAKAALLRGEIAALGVARKLGVVSTEDATAALDRIGRKLDRELALRPFLDALYKPRPQVFAPADGALLCRCEEVTAGDVRALARRDMRGPNQMKAASRAGMGPCQGRQCAYTMTRVLAEAQGRSPSDLGFFRIRPPLKPVTLAELASLHTSTLDVGSGAPP